MSASVLMLLSAWFIVTMLKPVIYASKKKTIPYIFMVICESKYISLIVTNHSSYTNTYFLHT